MSLDRVQQAGDSATLSPRGHLFRPFRATTGEQDRRQTLVRTGAVAFRTSPFFRLTSGAESPVYVDNRQLLGHVTERLEVIDAFIAAVATQQSAPEAIAGTATAGIPWGAWIADRLSLPFMYVRSQAKAWARRAQSRAPRPRARGCW